MHTDNAHKNISMTTDT